MQALILVAGVLLMATKFLAWRIPHSNTILYDAPERIVNAVGSSFALHNVVVPETLPPLSQIRARDQDNILPLQQAIFASMHHLTNAHRPLPTLLATLLLATACGQYQGPESVEYDPAGDRYFVSNTQSARITVTDQLGAVTDFALTPSAPFGLEIMGEVLYACTGNGVRGFSLATGAEVYQRDLGALFPNGITTDGEYLYITDFNSNARRIYKVDPVADTHSTLVANTGGQPNGIVWDAVGERLVTVFWGSNAPIKAYDRDTGAETVLLANSGLGNNDGVTIDCNGDFLISSWSPQRISRFEPTFSAPAQDLNVQGLGNPADIDFDATNQVVCIPNSSNNTVALWDISEDCLNTGMETPAKPALQAWPNPTAQHLRLRTTHPGPQAYQLLDARGLFVRSGTLHPATALDLHGLPAGLYTVLLAATGQAVRVVKE